MISMLSAIGGIAGVLAAALAHGAAAPPGPPPPPELVAALGEADAFLAQGRDAEALAAYERALAIEPQNVPLRVAIAAQLLRRDAPELRPHAYRFLREATEIEPNHHAANRVLGDWYFARDFFRESVDRYRRALASKPDDPDTLHNLALSLAGLKRFDEALKVAGEAVAASRGGARYRACVASIYNDWRKPTEALAALAPIDPPKLSGTDRQLFHRARAEARFQAGDPAGAIADATELTRVAPRSATGFHTLGLYLQRQERLAEAEAAFRSAVALDPASERAHFGLGTVLMRLGKAEEGKKELAAAREIGDRRMRQRVRDLEQMSEELKDRQKRGLLPGPNR